MADVGDVAGLFGAGGLVAGKPFPAGLERVFPAEPGDPLAEPGDDADSGRFLASVVDPVSDTARRARRGDGTVAAPA